jgi:hypothetical protein
MGVQTGGEARVNSAVEMDAFHICRGRHVATRRSKHSVSPWPKYPISGQSSKITAYTESY